MADRSDGSRLCCWHAREASALPSPPLCYYLPVGVEAVLCGRIRVTHGEQRLVVPDESKLQGGEAAGHTQQPKSVSRRVVIRELAERCGQPTIFRGVFVGIQESFFLFPLRR